jgi:hypothetical protein
MNTTHTHDMNRRTLGLVLLILMAALLGWLSGGCASTPKNVTKASAVTHATVKAALSGWNDYLGATYARLGTNTADVARRAELQAQEVKVRDAYRKYQAAQVAALSGAKVYLMAQGAPDQDRLNVALAASAEAGAELFALLTQFIPQLQPKH